MKILIIDDEKDVCKALADSLKSISHVVDTINNPLKAIQLFKKAVSIKEKYNAVITDFNMPEMNGIELSNKIKIIDSHIKIIIMSGYELNDTRKKVLNKEKYYFLKKPFALKKLIDILMNIKESIQINEGGV